MDTNERIKIIQKSKVKMQSASGRIRQNLLDNRKKGCYAENQLRKILLDRGEKALIMKLMGKM